jgi:hypothetical protein
MGQHTREKEQRYDSLLAVSPANQTSRRSSLTWTRGLPK